LAVAIGAGAVGRPSVSATAGSNAASTLLCAKGAFLPPLLPFPSWLRARWTFYPHPSLSPDSAAHHPLCNAAIGTPASTPKFLYDVYSIVFATHAVAAADLSASNPSALGLSVITLAPVAGFPQPAYELIALDHGKPVVAVAFVIGTAVMTTQLYGGGNLTEAKSLAHWALNEARRAVAASA
jgi:hypothetical protein